jgi:hypothetical protein
VNPSYYAPYAYRYFARDDPSHDWRQLVDTSYFLLERNSALTITRLPSDWLLLDTATGTLSLGTDRDSQYSYDAFRVHWRVRLDGVLFAEERARAYLASSLAWLAERHRQEGRLPAIISKDGQAGADYEAPDARGVMSALEGRRRCADAMDARLRALSGSGPTARLLPRTGGSNGAHRRALALREPLWSWRRTLGRAAGSRSER